MIKVLVKEKSEELGPALLNIIEDPKDDEKVKLEAVYTLGQMRYKKSNYRPCGSLFTFNYADKEDKGKLKIKEASLNALKELIKAISDDREAMLNMGQMLRIGETDEKFIFSYLAAFQKKRFSKR